MDADIGRLFARLKEHGIDENTLVLFTSDNGPHREGGNDPDFHDSNGPLKGTKRDLTEGGIRVPLIARWPGKVPAGATSNYIGGFQDVMPTLAELAGEKAESVVPDDVDGISFAAALTGDGEKQAAHDFLYWAFYERGGARAIRAGDFKAVQQPIHTPVRLYNLADDLGEGTDIAAQHAELVSRLTELMDSAYAPSDRWKFPEKE